MKAIIRITTFLAIFVTFCSLSVNGQEVNHFSHRNNEEILNKTLPFVNQFLSELSATRMDKGQQLREATVWLETQPGVAEATIIKQTRWRGHVVRADVA